MKLLTPRNIALACKGKLVMGPKAKEADLDKEVSCGVIDSRKVEQDGLFFASEGVQVDAHIHRSGV